MKSGIYCIKNLITKVSYIGSSKNINLRLKTHLYNLRNNKHPNKYLQNSWNKYKEDNFYIKIIEYTENLLEREQFYINNIKWNKLYNLTKLVNSGGGDTTKIPLFLLDLKGNIIKEFESGINLANYLNVKLLDYSSVNTKQTKYKKYRIVSKEFYKNNLNIIKSWKSYTSEIKFKSEIYNSYKYEVEFKNEIKKFKHKIDITKEYNIASSNITRFYKYLNEKNLSEYINKKTGHIFRYVKKTS